MSVNSKMTALADEIRELSGTEEAMGLDDMAEHVGEANADVATEADLIEQITSALEGKAAGGEVVEIALQSKTVTPTTSSQTVTADSGYDGLDKVTVNAMPTATQATPSITVDSSGKITASATQTAGYVAAGTKSATKQLTTQGAQTITPSTSDKTILSGRYLTGTQTIKGDSNLTSGNIKSGVSIFGVAGSFEGNGGSGDSVETCTITLYDDNDLLSGSGLYCTYLYSDGDIMTTERAEGGMTIETYKNSFIVFTSGDYTLNPGCGTLELEGVGVVNAYADSYCNGEHAVLAFKTSGDGTDGEIYVIYSSGEYPDII